jgi:hypothetical protein
MEVNALTGSRLSFPSFDRNYDNAVDADDLVTINLNGSDTEVAVTGLLSTEGSLTTPAILSAQRTEIKYSGGSSGGIFTTKEHPGPGDRGRQAWRTLP